MKIKILSDSTCDLSPEQIAEHDITLARLSIIKDGEAFLDGDTITPADIFAHVAAGGDLCSTNAFNVDGYQQLFAQYADKYDGIIHINLGSGFSSCYQNACIAAEDFPNVRVIDSQNLSTGQGHVVLEACRLAKTCESLDEIAEKLDVIGAIIDRAVVDDTTVDAAVLETHQYIDRRISVHDNGIYINV